MHAAAAAVAPDAAAAAPPPPPARGDVLELECTGLAFGGEGICRLPSGFVLFVERALPGERLMARVTHARRSYARAAKLSTLAPHDDAAEPPCPHFGPCGGCALQALRYEAQLAAKQRQVAELLARAAGVPDAAARLRPILGCPPDARYAYRNRMEFSFTAAEAQQQQQQQQHRQQQQRRQQRQQAQQRGGRAAAGPAAEGGELAVGLKRPGSSTAVLPIGACHLEPDAANALLQRVVQLCREHGLQPHDPRARAGLLQHVALRRGAGARSGDGGGSEGSGGGGGSEGSGGGEELLLNFVTAGDGRRALAPVAQALMREWGPQQRGEGRAALVGVVNSVAQRGRPPGERRVEAEHLLVGRGHLVERLCGLEFEVSANSFFQTNTAQAEALYGLVAQAAELRPSDVLLDLFCGTGSIGLSLAGRCAAVHGVELSAAAVHDAARNAARNGVANASFLRADLGRLQLEAALPAPDVVVVDPARPGLPPAVVAYLRRCGARRVVYVSCSPPTQARDIALLCGGGGGDGGPYRLAWAQPVDMFPQTWHVESVAVLDAVRPD